MKFLRQLSSAFSAGVVGTIALVLAVYWVSEIAKEATISKFRIYQLMIWGGIWGLLLVVPFFKNKWLLRGVAISAAVILFNFLVLIPAQGGGYFASKLSSSIFWGNICFNLLWGLVAAYWYKLIEQ